MITLCFEEKQPRRSVEVHKAMVVLLWQNVLK